MRTDGIATGHDVVDVLRAQATRFALPFAIAVCSFVGVVAFYRVCLGRIAYPLELDFIEGVVMDHVIRLAQGQPIYVEPSLSFVPLAYMPLLPALASLLATAFGPELWEPRLVNVVASSATALMVGVTVRAETRRLLLGVAAGGLFLSGLGIAGGHYDVARPDSLMLCLSMAGLVTLRFSTGRAGAVAAALLLGLAFFAKQHAALLGLAALVHVALDDRRRLVAFGATLGAVCAGGYLALELWLGHWFSFYTWVVPSGWSSIDAGRIRVFVGERLVGHFAALLVLAAMAAAWTERPWRGRSGLWWWVAAGAIGTGFMATLDPLAWDHTIMPTTFGLAILGAIAAGRLIDVLPRQGVSANGARNLVLALLVLQFLPLMYSPNLYAPRRGFVKAHHEFVELIREIPGPVMVPWHGFYARSAGKEMGFHHLALSDVVRSRGNRLLADDPTFFDRLAEPLRSGPGRPTIITDVPLAEDALPLMSGLAASYRLERELRFLSPTLMPISGSRRAPRYVYVPIEPPAAP